jgi:hypothetical protein
VVHEVERTAPTTNRTFQRVCLVVVTRARTFQVVEREAVTVARAFQLVARVLLTVVSPATVGRKVTVAVKREPIAPVSTVIVKTSAATVAEPVWYSPADHAWVLRAVVDVEVVCLALE